MKREQKKQRRWQQQQQHGTRCSSSGTGCTYIVSHTEMWAYEIHCRYIFGLLKRIEMKNIIVVIVRRVFFPGRVAVFAGEVCIQHHVTHNGGVVLFFSQWLVKFNIDLSTYVCVCAGVRAEPIFAYLLECSHPALSHRNHQQHQYRHRRRRHPQHTANKEVLTNERFHICLFSLAMPMNCCRILMSLGDSDGGGDGGGGGGGGSVRHTSFSQMGKSC